MSNRRSLVDDSIQVNEQLWQVQIEIVKTGKYAGRAAEMGWDLSPVRLPLVAETEFQTDSEFEPLIGEGGSSFLVKGFQQVTGAALKTQKLYKKVWTGSTSPTWTFNVALITKTDPEVDVRQPMTTLSKLALPAKEKGGLILVPPPLVHVTIPNVMRLRNMVLTSVQFTQMNKLIRKDPNSPALPLSAIGSVTVTPRDMLLAENVDEILWVNQGNNGNHYGQGTGNTQGKGDGRHQHGRKH